MLQEFCCTRCLRPLRTLGCHQGKTFRCPGCTAVVVVPAIANRQICEEPPSPVAEQARGGKATQGVEPLPARPLLPWVLLAPAALTVAVWMWTGHGVVWAGLGVTLGGLCLLWGQRGHWPMSVRVGVSLSLALLGHGLTLASPLRSAPERSTPNLASPPPLRMPLADGRFSPGEASSLTTSSRSADAEARMLRGLQRDALRRPPVPDLQPIARLGDLLAVAVAPQPSDEGDAFVATEDGSLKEFSYPNFRLRRVYRLEQPAYRTVLDERRRLLWTAACAPANLRFNRHGDRPLGRADLHVYSLPRSADNRATLTTDLHPRLILPVSGDVLELLISPDQQALFYLAQTDDGVRLGRIDAARQVVERHIRLSNDMRALCLTPDGQTLYAAGTGSVLVLDPATLRTLRSVPVKAAVYSVAADNDGGVYLAEQGQWTKLTHLDLRGTQPALRQWSSRLHGRIYVKMAPDQYRLYVGSSSVISDHLDSLLLRGHPWRTPLIMAMALSYPQTPVQGEFFLTTDGRFLINRWGTVYRLVQGEADLTWVGPS